VRARRQLATGR